MGFYGNINYSNKSAFTFDHVYPTRYAMEQAIENGLDDVFLGRYVLIEYDEQPISVYIETVNNYMFVYPGTAPVQTIDGTPRVITQALINELYPDPNNIPEGLIAAEPLSTLYADEFYYDIFTDTLYKGEEENNNVTLTAVVSPNPYLARSLIDIGIYGRGYDGTVWRKTYDDTNAKYKYVLLAELNAAIPSFHVTNLAPSNEVGAYSADIDIADSTNLNYYIKLATPWTNRFAANNITDQQLCESGTKTGENIANHKFLSDVKLSQPIYSFTSLNTETRKQNVTVNNQLLDVDIFYNAKGLNPNEVLSSQEKQYGDYIKQTSIASGRLYGVTSLDNGHTGHDTHLYSIHLPSIGKNLNEVWDLIYDRTDAQGTLLNSLNDYNIDAIQHRKVVGWERMRLGQSNTTRPDSTSVTGLINRMKDILGYNVQILDHNLTLPANIGSLTNDDLKTLYICYTPKTGSNDKNVSFQYYARKPNYIRWTPPSDPEAEIPSQLYYTENEQPIYYLGNYKALKDNNALTWYTQDGYTYGVFQIPGDSTSIYDLYIQLHELIGDIDPNRRDNNTLYGLLNSVTDVFDAIKVDLKENTIISTNDKGQFIETVLQKPTAQESANGVNTNNAPVVNTTVNNYLLNAGGTWNRLINYQLTGLSNSTNIYWSLPFPIAATNTIETALSRLQSAIDNSSYIQQTITLHGVYNYVDSFDTPYNGQANEGTLLIPIYSTITSMQLYWTLNKAPRKRIQITVKHNNEDISIENSGINSIAADYYSSQNKDYTKASDVNSLNRYYKMNVTTDDGPYVINNNNSITLGANKDQIKFTLQVKDEKDYDLSKSIILQAANYVYYGYSSVSTLENINNLININDNYELLATATPNINYTGGSGNTAYYLYYLQPTSYSDPKEFSGVGGSALPGAMDKTNYEITIITNEVPISYSVWRSTNPQKKYQFKVTK